MIKNNESNSLLYLQVVAGPHKGEVYPLSNKSVIGRDPSCTISLSKDNRISRQHAVIVFANNKFYIKNLSKSNKLFKNKKSIKESKIDFTDSITIGSSAFRMVLKKEKSDSFSSGKFNKKKKTKRKINPVTLIIGLILIGMGYMKLQPDNKGLSEKTKREITSQSSAVVSQPISLNDLGLKPKINVNAQSQYVKGFRDFKKGQYERGGLHFQRCLAFDPNHKLCSRYLTLSQKKIQELIQYNVTLGRKYKDQKQYKACGAAFRNVAFMIKRKDDKIYQEAIENEKFCQSMLEGNY